MYIIIHRCKEIFFTRRPESRELSGTEKNIEVSLLFDFYGELLKPSGKKAIDLYYNEDLSLAEVADEMGITRQGVRDSIKRSEQQLFEFEEKLGLFKQFSKLEQGLDEISALALEIKELSQDTQITELADVIIEKSGSLKD